MSYLFYGSGDSGARPGHLAPGAEESRHMDHPSVPGSSHMSYLFYGSGDSGARPGHLAPGPEEPCHLDHPGVPGSAQARPLLLFSHHQVRYLLRDTTFQGTTVCLYAWQVQWQVVSGTGKENMLNFSPPPPSPPRLW
jgi:hypothetical protein